MLAVSSSSSGVFLRRVGWRGIVGPGSLSVAIFSAELKISPPLVPMKIPSFVASSREVSIAPLPSGWHNASYSCSFPASLTSFDMKSAAHP